MHAHELIARLADTPGRLDKEQIIRDAFLEGHRDFFTAAKIALDPLVTFGVKKVPLIDEADDGVPGTLDLDGFLVLARKLIARELTGHAARDAIIDALNASNIGVWNGFYRRILLKDFKMGCESNTINGVLKKLAKDHPEAEDYVIPVFSCQLAQDGADEKHAKKLDSGTWLLDRKLDGVRLLTILDKDTGEVRQHTRNGKLNENFTEITEALAKLLPMLPGSVVLDGEVVSTSFQELMTQVNRRSEKDTGSAKLALFDIVPLADFLAGSCKKTQTERHSALAQLQTSGALQETCGDLVYVLPKILVDLDTQEGRETFTQFNRDMVEQGYEGIMCKRPEAPYTCKRRDDWLKVKPFIEVSLEIVGVEEGKPDGKYKGMLGALVCRGEDDGRLIETNVGSGLTDAQRVELWERREELLGMIVEIRADALTLERGETVYSMRFPRLKGFRGTVPGEKL
jgi:DNA ligase-1